MSEELIREIAQEIVRQMPPMGGWAYYVILGLGMMAAAFLGSYLRERGKNYATKADMKQVLERLEATTKTTEEVRATVAHADWHTREWKTLRRTKLEELIGAINHSREQLNTYTREILYNETAPEEIPPTWSIPMLCGLYVPELRGEVQRVLDQMRAYTQWAHDLAAQRPPIATGGAPLAAYRARVLAEAGTQINVLRDAVQVVHDSANGLMREFAVV